MVLLARILPSPPPPPPADQLEEAVVGATDVHLAEVLRRLRGRGSPPRLTVHCPVPPAEPIETAEAKEPNADTMPAAPTAPAEPTESTEPAVPTEPVAPVEPAESVEPAVPVEPAESVEPAVPVEPAEPSCSDSGFVLVLAPEKDEEGAAAWAVVDTAAPTQQHVDAAVQTDAAAVAATDAAAAGPIEPQAGEEETAAGDKACQTAPTLESEVTAADAEGRGVCIPEGGGPSAAAEEARESTEDDNKDRMEEGSAHMYDLAFPVAGALGLSLLPHCMTYTAPDGLWRQVACCVVAHVVPGALAAEHTHEGDVLVAINGKCLLSSDGAHVGEGQGAFFDAVVQAVTATEVRQGVSATYTRLPTRPAPPPTSPCYHAPPCPSPPSPRPQLTTRMCPLQAPRTLRMLRTVSGTKDLARRDREASTLLSAWRDCSAGLHLFSLA